MRWTQGESDVPERSVGCPEVTQTLTVRVSTNAGDTGMIWARTERRNRGGITPQRVSRWSHAGDGGTSQSTPYFASRESTLSSTTTAPNCARDSGVTWKRTSNENLGGISPQSVPNWTHLGDVEIIKSTPYLGSTKRPFFKDGDGLPMRRALQDV